MGEMEPFPGGGRYTTTFPEDEGKRCAPVEAVVSGRAENLFFGMEPFRVLVVSIITYGFGHLPG